MIRLLFFILAVAAPAAADTARVLSGEHDDFTRLVVELPDTSGWTLGRTATGYAFATRSDAQPHYDLTAVWQRIPQTRLGSLTIDAESGALELGLGCTCHVFPFEYRPGVVVLDIKPGPAPAGSVFEARFVGAASRGSEPVEAPATYDWIAGRKTDAGQGSSPRLPLPLKTGTVSLEPLRDELLEEIARGAADGLVDMALPGKPQKPVGEAAAALPWANIHIGEPPGVAVSDAYDTAPSEAACPDPALLDLPSWGGTQPSLDLLAAAHAGLYVEFDAPDPEAIRQAVRHLVYLGFGAEARQTADLVGAGPPDADLALLRSMAMLVDGQSDPETPFAVMLGCDGPASLWAALAHDRLPAGAGVNRDAVLQAFLALPAHLRRHLGPSLAEKFLARDDAEAARVIRDAIERSPEADPAAIALLDAKAELQDGDPKAAQAHAETAVALDGDQTAGLVALVEAHVRTLEPLPAAPVEALLALRGEIQGTVEAASVDRAAILALALSGQTDAAFADPGASGPILSDLWRVVAERATDDDFLLQAVLPAATPVPDVSPETGLTVAARLLRLGFPDAAQSWLGPTAKGDPPERLRLAAEAAFRNGDARAAVALAEGLDDPEARRLRAEALIQLGDLPAAEAALAAAGDQEGVARLSPWKGDWAGLDPSLPALWQGAAESVTVSTTVTAAGPLGRGDAALKASAASREAIEALLAGVAAPAAE